MSTTAITAENNLTKIGAKKTSFTIHSFIAILFAIKLREALDAATSGDKSDAAWVWGL